MLIGHLFGTIIISYPRFFCKINNKTLAGTFCNKNGYQAPNHFMHAWCQLWVVQDYIYRKYYKIAHIGWDGLLNLLLTYILSIFAFLVSFIGSIQVENAKNKVPHHIPCHCVRTQYSLVFLVDIIN